MYEVKEEPVQLEIEELEPLEQTLSPVKELESKESTTLKVVKANSESINEPAINEPLQNEEKVNESSEEKSENVKTVKFNNV